jgi:hypothetical protein
MSDIQKESIIKDLEASAKIFWSHGMAATAQETEDTINELMRIFEADDAKIERLTNRGIEDMKHEIETQKAEIARLRAVIERLADERQMCIKLPTNPFYPFLQYEYEMQTRLKYARDHLNPTENDNAPIRHQLY